MSKRKQTPIPHKFKTIAEASDYWDKHSIADHWGEAKEAKFDIALKKDPRYFALDTKLSKEVAKISRQRGVSPETLLNLWVKEKISAK